MGTLTREEMHEVIRQGGSVMIAQHIHSTIDTLPSEVDMALGNEEKESVAEDAIDAQVAELLAQRKRITNERDNRKKSDQERNKSLHAAKGEESKDEDPEDEESEGGLPVQGDNIGEEEREREHTLAESGQEHNPYNAGRSTGPANAQPGAHKGRAPASGAKGKETS